MTPRSTLLSVLALASASPLALAQFALNLSDSSMVGGMFGPPDAADVVVFDLNEDGFMDIVTYNTDGYQAPPFHPDFLAYMLGNGDGTFQPVVDSIPTGFTTTGSPEFLSRMMLGEFTGDVHPDLVLTHHGTQQVALIPNDGAGGFGTPVLLDTGSLVSSLHVGDFNGDGLADVVTVSRSGFALSFLAGTGTGLAAPVTQVSGLLSSYEPLDFDVADVNGDGELDVLVPYLLDETQTLTNEVVGFHGNGNGTFDVANPFFVDMGPPLAGSNMTIQIADLDADGFQDVVGVRDIFTSGASDHLHVAYGNGAGFDPAQAYTVSGQENLSECVVADLNFDGNLDVATVCNGPFVIEVLLGDGMRGLAPQGQIDVFGQAGMYSIAAADVSGDMKLDVIVGYHFTGHVQVWRNDTPGQASLGTNYCVAGANSVSATGSIMSAFGSVSVSADDLLLRASNAPTQPAIFFYGPNQVQIPFGNGFRCVGGTVTRMPPVTASGGVIEYQVDMVGDGLSAGTHNFQCWYRDPAAGGAFFNLSDGLQILLTP